MPSRVDVDDDEREALLLAVLDHYGWPTPGYGERSMRCPVHDDSHASASVNRAKGVMHCHACGFGGSGIDLVMAREGLDYPAALAFIEAQVGLTPAPMRPQQRRASRSGTRWVPPRLRGGARA